LPYEPPVRKPIKLRDARKLENFIALIESRMIEMAEEEGVKIQLDRDFRGRYATLIVRAVQLAERGERMVIHRKVDGKRLK